MVDDRMYDKYRDQQTTGGVDDLKYTVLGILEWGVA